MTREAQQPTDLLAAYSALVRQYHATLDLVSPAALADWESLLADALLYDEIISELAPDGGDVLDLGSGVGLPGLPLAIRRPDSAVLLVERRRRRSAFLQLASGQLGLDNVTVVTSDVREVTGGQFPVITAQAVSTFASVHALSRHLQAPEVILLSSKGAGWEAEAEELTASAEVRLVASAVRSRSAAAGVIVGLRLQEGN
ncbi:MAG TPA: RsmG family class I SAM-dependent methyltransferase [Deinococcales bacterium]|nr:RsmG family class I SAM-dependent methyltransferase [Deinococcales bacterium]